MAFDNITREVTLICPVCGHDQFSSDYDGGGLCEAPDSAPMTCAYCGAGTTKGELIEANSAVLDAAFEDMQDEIAEEVKKEFDKALRKAFR